MNTTINLIVLTSQYFVSNGGLCWRSAVNSDFFESFADAGLLKPSDREVIERNDSVNGSAFVVRK